MTHDAPTRLNLMSDSRLDLSALTALTGKPAYFEPGEPQFWDDPHIAGEMLKAHLDTNTEAASRHPDIIRKTVRWVTEHLALKSGDALLDLGCGPGLYCRKFSRQGLRVTGVDISENSLEYARAHDSAGTYLKQNYVRLDVAGPFKAATLIYGDFCVLPDADRDQFLVNVNRVLEPGGHFVLDVTTPTYFKAYPEGKDWYISRGGFWKPGPHTVLQHTFAYPDRDTSVDQYIVIEENGTVSVYRNWLHHYTPETLTPILERHGFAVLGTYSDLMGTPYTPESMWLGLVVQKVEEIDR